VSVFAKSGLTEDLHVVYVQGRILCDKLLVPYLHLTNAKPVLRRQTALLSERMLVENDDRKGSGRQPQGAWLRAKRYSDCELGTSAVGSRYQATDGED
jgi:hypothetical protein